jgi:hypothetical protein
MASMADMETVSKSAKADYGDLMKVVSVRAVVMTASHPEAVVHWYLPVCTLTYSI